MSNTETMGSQQSSMSDDFNFVAKGLKWAAFGLFAAVSWQVLLDPIFFPIMHDVSNPLAQAYVAYMGDAFSWLPDIIGLTGDGGLFNMDWAQDILEPYYDTTIVPQNADYDIFSDDLSFDDF